MNKILKKVYSDTIILLEEIKKNEELVKDTEISKSIKDIETILHDEKSLNTVFQEGCNEYLEKYSEQMQDKYIFSDPDFLKIWIALSFEERKKVVKTLKDNSQDDLADYLSLKIVVYEDFPELSDSVLRQLIKQIDSRKIAISLKTLKHDNYDKQVSKKVFSKISAVMSHLELSELQDDIDFMGYTKKEDVYDARIQVCKVVEKILNL